MLLLPITIDPKTNPNNARGWKERGSRQEIRVTHWQRLPISSTSNRFDGICLAKFVEVFDAWRPPLGNVIKP